MVRRVSLFLFLKRGREEVKFFRLLYIYIYIYLKLERSRVFSFFLLGFSNFRSVFGGIIFVRVIILRGSSCVVHIVWLLWCLLGVKN